MEFLHARIHHARLRELSATGATPTDFARNVVFVHCPTCGDAYFANLNQQEEPRLLDDEEWAAVVHLDAECPDHAHRFSV